MKTEMKDKLSRLLTEKLSLCKKRKRSPQNYTEVCKQAFLAELKSEVEFLQKISTKSIEEFKECFLKRTRERQQHPEKYTSLSLAPQSPANELYFEIAKLIFDPKNLNEYMNILSPDSKKVITAQTPDTIPDSFTGTAQSYFKQHKHDYPIEFQEKEIGLTQNEEEITFDVLSNFVFADDLIFDCRQLINLPIGCLQQIFEYLEKKYPKLAKKLKNHNYELSTIERDISTYKGKGVTPRQAIKRLITGLTLGGSSFSGQTYARDISTKAVGEFMEYLEEQPEKIRNDIRELSGGFYNINSVIYRIAEGNCVESTAGSLTHILERNRGNQLLDKHPNVDSQTLQRLKKKYTKNILDSKKTNILPDELIKNSIKKIKVDPSVGITTLLLEFPPSSYKLLLGNIPSIDLHQHEIIAGLANNFYNEEQGKAIIDYLIQKPSIDIFGLLRQLFSAPDLLSYCLRYRPDVSLNDLFFNSFCEGVTLSSPRLLKIFLDSYPKQNGLKAVESIYIQNRLKAVESIYINGRSLLEAACPYPESLKMLLELYRENKRFDIIIKLSTNPSFTINKDILLSVPEDKRLTILLQCSTIPEDPTVFMEILAAIPKTCRLEAIQIHQNKVGSNIFEYLSDIPEKFKELLELIPKESRLLAIKCNRHFEIFMESLIDRNNEVLKNVLELYDEEELITTITSKYASHSYGRYLNSLLLYAASHNPWSLQTLLEMLPREKRINTLKLIDCPTGNFFQMHPISLQRIMEICPTESLFNNTESIDDFEKLLFVSACKNHETLTQALACIPQGKHYDIIKALRNKIRESLSTIYDFKPMKILLEIIPENNRLEFINYMSQGSYDRYLNTEPLCDLLPIEDLIKVKGSISEQVYNPCMVRKIINLLEGTNNGSDIFEELLANTTIREEIFSMFSANSADIIKNEKIAGVALYYIHACKSKKVNKQSIEQEIKILEDNLDKKIKSFLEITKNNTELSSLQQKMNEAFQKYQKSTKTVNDAQNLQKNLKSEIRKCPNIQENKAIKTMRIIADILFTVTLLPMLVKILVSKVKPVGFFGKSATQIKADAINESASKLTPGNDKT